VCDDVWFYLACLQFEFEPEYLMGEFDKNPDIDEKPPMPLRDALEKVKPFMMAYMGIKTHEEWEVLSVIFFPLIHDFIDIRKLYNNYANIFVMSYILVCENNLCLVEVYNFFDISILPY
jgi:hypothetical protein